jgi:Domain of unknown function (DUF202)
VSGPAGAGYEDRGLQAERTRLAWRRTALSGTAVALLTARYAVVDVGGPAGAALTAVVAFSWLGLLAAAFRRVRSMGPGRPPPVARALGVAALTVGYAALGVALVLARGGG